ncbi:hypothetical protein GQ44DRAFT_812254 [Phaeosphaeriaceae sp. PMI808]|nr:hypothetical protein GQ44DRAFT_812254 [Phaeosphaeriaceae sp. PMI808]
MGCGETTIDIAYTAFKLDAKSVTMCFGIGVLSFPTAFPRFKGFGKQFKDGMPINSLIN